jgi:hypothetical protein
MFLQMMNTIGGKKFHADIRWRKKKMLSQQLDSETPRFILP